MHATYSAYHILLDMVILIVFGDKIDMPYVNEI
jgi:hypothetical protein